jgi:hypothetical protein
LDDARVVIPALEHKGGRVAARQGREMIARVIDLPDVAVEAIAAQLPAARAAAPDALVFPPMIEDAEQLELSRAWRAVRDTAGLSHKIVMHTARHSIATAGAIAGMTNTQLAAVLGHSQTHTTERYAAIARSRQQRLGSLAFMAAMSLQAEEAPSRHSTLRKADDHLIPQAADRGHTKKPVVGGRAFHRSSDVTKNVASAPAEAVSTREAPARTAARAID